MEVKIITDKQMWNAPLERAGAVFTQSWEWGEILLSEGKKVERLAVYEGGKMQAAAQVVFSKIFGFTFGFCPKGPVVFDVSKLAEVYSAFAKFLKSAGCAFFRVEPSGVIPAKAGIHKNGPTIVDSGSWSGMTIKKTIDLNPRATTMVDLGLREEELLARMHAKTRYNIRLGEKKGLQISEEKNWEHFWNLMRETGKRDGFRLHEKAHYEAIFQSPFTKQLTALFDSKPVATMILVGFGKTLTYLFGASDHEHRQLMAPQLLQWEALKLGKKMGFLKYDLFGIAPKISDSSEYEYDPKHQYAGVTRFKLGLGGAVVEQPGTFDLIISPRTYRMYEVLRGLRRLI